MKKNGILNRRNFIKTSALGVAGIGIAGKGNSLSGENYLDPAIFPKITKYKTLGRTGFKASD